MPFNLGGAPRGIGAQLTQPQAPTAAGQADPKQMGLWAAFRQKLASDPNLRMALMQTGANMMRSPEFGKNGFDVFADSATTGMGTLDMLRQRDIERKTAADAQEFKESSTNRQLDQGDRRVGAAETGVKQRGDQIAIQRGQLAESVRQFESTLNEEGRQFDARLQAGDFTGAAGSKAGSTGPERREDLAYKAFIDSGIYPDTSQGQALARLRAGGLIGQDLTNPRDRFSYASELAKDLILFRQDLTEAEAVEKASNITDMLAARSNAGDPAVAEEADPEAIPNYNGQMVYDKEKGEGKALDLGNGKYTVTFGVGRSKQVYEMTEQELHEWMQQNGSQ